KRPYEEQEDKWKQRIAQKDDLVAQLEADVAERDRQLQARLQHGAEIEGEVQHVRQESERTRQEMAAKIAQLNDRIKELNQRLLAATGGAGTAATPTPSTGGFFKR
ncbi:MAG TPA: hypothetical protein PLB02_11240, partial [Thermoanaerobaculia bacterium]|nr:hypothetical protein [Thermoanaerobaculia bacterium]